MEDAYRSTMTASISLVKKDRDATKDNALSNSSVPRCNYVSL